MQKYTKEQLEAQYNKLPDALKDALFSVDVASKIYGIGRKFGLTIEKTGFMAEETGYVVLGLTRPTEFVQFLANVLETEESKTRAIANEINNLIFFPLREALKTAHQMEITEEEIQRGATEIKKAELTPTLPSPSQIFAPTVGRPKEESVKTWEGRLTPPPAPTPPPTPPKSPEIKPFTPPAPTSLPATPKIPPIDLRSQTKPKPPLSLPKPEIMGKGIFGAPPVINSIPKPEQPKTQEKTPPAVPQKSTPKSYDPYKEPIE